MYNKMKTGALAFVCAALVLCAGCSAAENSSSAEATPSPTAAPTATAEPTATPVPELKVVGEKSDSKDTFCVTLENGTKQEITAVSVKTGSEEKFPESMMKKGETLAKDEKFELYYTPKTEEESSGSGDEYFVSPRYDVQLTLKDGKTYVLHGFPFEDIKEGTVLLEDDIAYITYTSVSTKEKIDTKEAERATKEAENGEVSVQTEEKPASAAEVVTEEPTYEEPSYEKPSYEEPSYEEPSYEEPSYEEPAAPENPDNGGQEGCVNGALFN